MDRFAGIDRGNNASALAVGGTDTLTMKQFDLLLTLGWAAEYAEHGVAANCLWPETYIVTDAMKNILGLDAAIDRACSPENVAGRRQGPRTDRKRMHRPHSSTSRGSATPESRPLVVGGTGNPEYDIFVDRPRRRGTRPC
ncbi:hypothetical protein [Streptomyces sp. NPDC017993]|uniref:hypothetical protein n=1 Tax=Streptomyces sp. NPDC017993 TaxID=3365027 RepID=UPI00379259D9